MIVFLMEANTIPGPFGEKCLSAIVAQGIPSCFHVVQVLRLAARVSSFHDIIFLNLFTTHVHLVQINIKVKDGFVKFWGGGGGALHGAEVC